MKTTVRYDDFTFTATADDSDQISRNRDIEDKTNLHINSHLNTWNSID